MSPSPVSLVRPPVLRMHLLWLLRFSDPYRMIVVDVLEGSWRPTIIAVFSDSYPSPQPRCPFRFPLPSGQTMDLATPNIGLHRTP
jgi:hypothetical protein